MASWSITYREKVLQRHFSRWSTVSYAISILGVLGSVPATFGSPMSAGGPATAVWAWFIGSIMAYCIASSGTHPAFCRAKTMLISKSRRVGLCVPDSWRHVLCHEARCPSQRGRSLGMDNRVVQFPRPGCRRCESGVHHFPDDSRHGCDALVFGRRVTYLCTVRAAYCDSI